MAKKVIGDINFFDEDGDIIDRLTNEQLRVDKVKSGTDFLKLLSSFGIRVRKNGKGYMALCPFHEDKNPSLSIAADEKVFKCFGCGKSGDVIKFVEYYKGIKFKEALKFLNEFNGSSESRLRIEDMEVPQPLVNKEPQHIDDVLDKLDEPKETEQIETEQKNNAQSPAPEPKPNEEPVNIQPLYQEIVKIYQQDLQEEKEALKYLESRGLKNREIRNRAGLGFSNGKRITDRIGEDQREALIETGFLNKDGGEFFNNCLVFPIFDDNENVVGFYGRDINDNSNFKHRYLKGKHKSVFNLKASKVFPEQLILTESIIDAMSLMELGFNNVQACYGTNGYTDEMLLIHKNDNVREIVIAFDKDEAGIKAGIELKEKLINENFRIKIISPPNKKDWNEELIAGITAGTIKELIEKAEIHEKEQAKERFELTKIPSGYRFKFEDNVSYEVLNFKDDYAGPLKVILKVEAYNKMHCDDFNLYVYRGRENFTRQAEYLTGLPADRCTEHIRIIIKKLEDIRNKKLQPGKEEQKEEELTEEEIEIGMRFLTNPKLFEELKEDLDLIGCVGENKGKVLLYLVATSRLRANPIPAYVFGRSSAGKSYLVKTVLKLVPSNEKFIITKVSPEVIYYMKKGLKNKVVMVGEFDGAEDIEYLLREMVSDGRVSKLVTLKNPETGLPEPFYLESEGPISLISTSAKPEDINPENLTRCILMHIDESQEQTQRILEYQRFIDSKGGFISRGKAEEVVRKHHIVQRLLEDIVVFNTFGEEFDFPTLLLLARRAHFNFLRTIDMVAFQLQKQHEIKEMEINSGGEVRGEAGRGKKIRYIETDIRDYEIAYNLLMDGIMENTLDEMSVNAKNLHRIMLKQVTEIAEQEGKTIDTVYLERQEVVIYSGWTTKQVRTAVKVLIDYGYLEIVAGKDNGKRHKYRVLNINSRVSELLKKIPTPEEMKKRIKEKGKM